jgi:DNA-binding response OmpR family regulator
MNRQASILLVDDEILNLEILTEHLHDANYQAIRAEDSSHAWDLLLEDQDRFDTVLLDRMMPEMDGLELLIRIKQNPQLAMIPVILQSAKAAKSDIYEGLEAGANYYLTKPFDGSHLLSIVELAIGDYSKYRAMKASPADLPKLQDHEEFSFRTRAEAQDLARLFAINCENGEVIASGLLRLMVNAIEHGNLEIGFEKKARLMVSGLLREEVKHRLEDSIFGSRQAKLIFDKTVSEYSFQVTNEGPGFNSHQHLEINTGQTSATGGHSAPQISNISFDSLEYSGNGNTVRASHRLITDSSK